MMDDKLDEQLRDLTADYNQPPETPRELMWAAIQKDRAARKAPRRVGWKPLVWGGLAAAAVLLVGIMIGSGMKGTGEDQVAVNFIPDSGNSSDRAFHIAAVEYLGETEEFLTVFRADLKQGLVDKSAPERARQLLSANRLLMDSPAGQDPRISGLLQDLELVLAEITRVSGTGPGREEAGFIDDGLEEGGLMERLRTAVPAGQPVIGL